MKVPITIPQLGVIEEAVISSWERADGERVAAGDLVLVLETDKASTDVEAPADGLLEIVVPAGDDVIAVGTVVGYVAQPDV